MTTNKLRTRSNALLQNRRDLYLHFPALYQWLVDYDPWLLDHLYPMPQRFREMREEALPAPGHAVIELVTRIFND